VALSAAIEWEVRPTNGTINAGGGFEAGSGGTDRSQQDAVQVAIDNAAITTSITTNVITFTGGYTVLAGDDGNTVSMLTGVNIVAETFGITSVDTGAGTWTLDRNVVTSGTTTDATGNMGGARSGFVVGTRHLQLSLVAGQTVHVKNEAWNEEVILSVAGAAGAPITIEGYNITHGDEPTGTNRPLNDRATAGSFCITSVGRYIYKHLRVTRSGGSGIGFTGEDCQLVNVRSFNNASHGIVMSSGNKFYAFNCEADTNTGNGFNLNSGNSVLVGCNPHDNTISGIRNADSELALAFNIVEANASIGIEGASDINMFLANTVDGNTGASSDGFFMTTPSGGFVLNNIFSNNGRYGFNATDADVLIPDFNNYFNNATAARNNVPVGPNDVALDPEFTNRAAGDFSIGTNLRALGFPGVFPGGLSTGFLDIGAVQREEAAGGAVAHPIGGSVF